MAKRSDYCKYCINKTYCEDCKESCYDRFIPSDEVKEYFYRSYVGVRGINGYTYSFNGINPSLSPTHSIYIKNTPYCAYCGEPMFYIYHSHTDDIEKGFCCICESARAEMEYEKKKDELTSKYEEDLFKLQKEYKEKLTFCSEKLIEIKHQQELDALKFFKHERTHFSTLNGKPFTEINQIVY